jgi:hypothetical protein
MLTIFAAFVVGTVFGLMVQGLLSTARTDAPSRD